MSRLKQLVLEIHRRSLWQALLVYFGASYAVLEAVDLFIERFGLPDWLFPLAFLLLLVGLPVAVVLAVPRGVVVPKTAGEETTGAIGGGRAEERSRLLTWRTAGLAFLGALAMWGVVATAWYVAVPAGPRVTEARGAAGDAFGERDWIVVTQFEAPEGEAETALAARAALLVDLQQSRFVNVYGRSQIRPVLRRMGRPDTTSLNEQLALEVAEREGLAAVLALALGRLGDEYSFTARVLQPGTGIELAAVAAAARADRLVEGVEALSRKLRGQLGEASAAIQASKPLPQATTQSLEALKKHAQAGDAVNRGRRDQALQLNLEAIRLDSTFAAAYAGVAIQHYSGTGRLSEAARYITQAHELRDGLTDRERLNIEAFYHLFVEYDPRRAAEAWDLLLSLYPDAGGSLNNLGVMAGEELGERERAYQAFRRSLEINPHSRTAFSNVIEEAHWTGRWDIADSLVQSAEVLGFHDLSNIQVNHALALREWSRATALCDSLLGDASVCGYLDIARGRVDRGIRRLESVAEVRAEQRRYGSFDGMLGAIAVAEQMRGRTGAARSRLEEMLARFPGDSLPEPGRFQMRTQRLVLAAQLGHLDVMERIEVSHSPNADTALWFSRYLTGLESAAHALAVDEAERAIELLRGVTSLGYEPRYLTFVVELMLGQAFDRLGEADSAIVHLEAAIEPARIAWYYSQRPYLPLVVRRLAQLEESRGNAEAAIRHYQQFIELWEDADPELQPRVEAARRAISALSPDQ